MESQGHFCFFKSWNILIYKSSRTNTCKDTSTLKGNHMRVINKKRTHISLDFIFLANRSWLSLGVGGMYQLLPVPVALFSQLFNTWILTWKYKKNAHHIICKNRKINISKKKKKSHTFWYTDIYLCVHNYLS